MPAKKRIHFSFWQNAEAIPPILARLLAHDPHGLVLSDVEIAKRSGLDECDVLAISYRLNWKSVDEPTMMSYLRGCGVDFCDKKAMHRVWHYLPRHKHSRQPTWQHLRRSPQWNGKYKPLLKRWNDFLKSQTT